MDTIRTIMSCVTCAEATAHHNETTEQDIADDFVTALLSAEKRGKDLDDKLDEIVGVSGWNWKETLAKAILDKLAQAIAVGAHMSSAMRDAVEKSIAAAKDFAQEHPVYTTPIAIGVLVVLSPWVIKALGFGEPGPIEGTFAAAWQGSFAGNVPQGALFTYFQRLGMIWRRHLKTQSC